MAQSVAQSVLVLIIPQKLDVPAAFKGLLAMARATAAETADRIDTLQGLILEGIRLILPSEWGSPQWAISANCSDVLAASVKRQDLSSLRELREGVFRKSPLRAWSAAYAYLVSIAPQSLLFP